MLTSVAVILQSLGVFPVIYDNDNNCIIETTDPNVKISKKHLCMSAIQMALISFRCYGYYHVAIMSKYSALTTTLFSLEIVWVTGCLVLSLWRLKAVYICLIKASKILTSTSSQPDKFTTHCLVFCNFGCHFTHLLVQLSIILYRMTLTHWAYLAAQTLTEMMPMSVNSFLIMLLVVLENSYADINKQILQAANNKHAVLTLSSTDVSLLGTKHWDTGDLTEFIKSTFNLDILVFSSYTLVKLVLVVYYTFIYDQLFISKDFTTNLARKALSLASFVNTTVNMFVLCSQAEAVSSQSSRTLALLYRLLRRKGELMSEETEKQVRIFQLQVRSRRIHLSGCGFFDLDKSLFYGLVMQVVSYFIILVQFEIFQH